MDISIGGSSMELRYAQFLLDVRDRPLKWGQHDCVIFAAECVLIRTGRNVLDVPIDWTTALEAARKIEELGGLRHAVSQRLGEPVGIVGAKIGDVALLEDPVTHRELLGVVHDQCILAPSEKRLAVLPTSMALCRWRV